MQYMLMLYADEGAWGSLDEEAQGAVMAEHEAASQAMKAQRAYVGGEALELSDSAATLRIRDGGEVITDGPFVEAKEMLGGFYIVECASREEALRWAARLPEARIGGVEVRPILDIAALQAEGAAGEGPEAG
jgi:hypothetical protein